MKTFLLVLISLLSISCFSQKEDYVWLFGYGGTSGNPAFGDIVLNFNSNPVEIFRESRDLDLDLTNASICDQNGDLLLYSNGVSIYNGKHQLLENGNGINLGYYESTDEELGYRLYQGAIFIKHPNLKNYYYLFHVARELKQNPTRVEGVGLFYSLIDIQSNSGRGKVIEKNIPVIKDEITIGRLTAVKHGNGRDWWIIIPLHQTATYFKVLVNQTGVVLKGSMKVGKPIPNGLGQAVFSPDGTKYVRNGGNSAFLPKDLNIYDFDRCTGQLSNPIHFTYGDTSRSSGLAISENSKYLYISSDRLLLQYDLSENNIKSTEDTIAFYDGFLSPFPTRFFLAQLAPNGKIYLNTSSSNNVLHVIQEPNKKGKDCRFEQHAVDLEVFNVTLPNFPNYRLGALQNSPCDTLFTTTAESIQSNPKITLYPNPTSGEITIDFEKPTDGTGQFLLFDLTGKQVREFSLAARQSSFQFELNELARGMYFYKIETEGIPIKTGKLVIEK